MVLWLLTSSTNQKYIVKVRPFLSGKTVEMLDYIKPAQRNFNPDVYTLHIGAIYRPTNHLKKCL